MVPVLGPYPVGRLVDNRTPDVRGGGGGGGGPPGGAGLGGGGTAPGGGVGEERGPGGGGGGGAASCSPRGTWLGGWETAVPSVVVSAKVRSPPLAGS